VSFVTETMAQWRVPLGQLRDLVSEKNNKGQLQNISKGGN